MIADDAKATVAVSALNQNTPGVYTTTNEYTDNRYSLTGMDLSVAQVITIFVKAEDGTVADYKLHLKSTDANSAASSISILMEDGTWRDAVWNDVESRYHIKLSDVLTEVDVRVTPASTSAKAVRIGGVNATETAANGGRIRRECSTASDLEVIITAADGSKSEPIILVFDRVRVDTSLSRLQVNDKNVDLTNPINGFHVYSLSGTDLDDLDHGKIGVVTTDTNATATLELMTPVKGADGTTTYTYTLCTPEVDDNAIWKNLVFGNKYRVTVTAADEYTKQEYLLAIEAPDDNKSLESVIVGGYQAKYDEASNAWEVALPIDTTFAYVDMTTDNILASIGKNFSSGEWQQHTLRSMINGMDLQSNGIVEKTIYVKSALGNVGASTLRITGSATAPGFTGVTVNRLAATAPTADENRYTFLSIPPNATEAEVTVKANLNSLSVQIEGGTTGKGAATQKITMQPEAEEKIVNFSILGTTPLTNQVVLRRLEAGYGLLLAVDGTTLTADDFAADGSYHYEVGANQESIKLEAFAAGSSLGDTNSPYIVTLKDNHNLSVDNSGDKGSYVSHTFDLETTGTSTFWVEIKAKDAAAGDPFATYPIYVDKLQNNTALKNVISNPANSYQSVAEFDAAGGVIWTAYIPIDTKNPASTTYSGSLKVEAEDSKAQVSVKNSTYMTGTWQGTLALSNPTTDVDGNMVYVVPVKVKSVNGVERDYEVHLIRIDMSAELVKLQQSGSAGWQEISRDNSGNYTIYEDRLNNVTALQLISTANSWIEILDEDGVQIATSGNASIVTLTNLAIHWQPDMTAAQSVDYLIKVHSKECSYVANYPLKIYPKSEDKSIMVEVEDKTVSRTTPPAYLGYDANVNADKATVKIKISATDAFTKVGIKSADGADLTGMKLQYASLEPTVPSDQEFVVYQICVEAQDGSTATHMLRITKRESDNTLEEAGVVRTDTEPEQAAEEITDGFAFYVNNSSERVPIRITPNNGRATVKVKYDDGAGGWTEVTSGFVSNPTCSLSRANNNGQYVIEVKAENGDIKAYNLYLYLNSAEAGLGSITFQKGKLDEYNVDMTPVVVYEARVQQGEVGFEIKLKEQHATILEIVQVSSANNNVADMLGGKKANALSNDGKGSYSFSFDAGVAVDKIEYYRVKVKAQNGQVINSYLRLKGFSTDVGIQEVQVDSTVNTVASENRYLFSTPADKKTAAVTITANSTAKIAAVNGVSQGAVGALTNLWKDKAFTLSASSDSTVIPVEIYADFYESSIRTPNAKKDYTVEIYKTSNNVAVSTVKVNGVNAIASNDNPTVYEVAIPSTADYDSITGAEPIGIQIDAINPLSSIKMTDSAATPAETAKGQLSVNRETKDPIASVDNSYTFDVESSSGGALQHYTLYVYRDYEDLTVGSATMNGQTLTMGGNTEIDLLSNTTVAANEYLVTVDNLNPITLSIVPNGRMAQVRLTGYGISSPLVKRGGLPFENLALNTAGDTVFEYQILSSDGKLASDTYKITVRYANKETTGLKSVVFAGKEAAVADWDAHIYLVNIGTTVTNGRLVITGTNTYQAIEYNGNRSVDGVLNVEAAANDNPTKFEFTVSSRDGGSAEHYTLYVMKTPTTLGDITVNNTAPTKESGMVYSYLALPGATQANVKVTTDNPIAKVSIGNNQAGLGSSETLVNLSSTGKTVVPVTISVYPYDSVNTLHYTLNIDKPDASVSLTSVLLRTDGAYTPLTTNYLGEYNGFIKWVDNGADLTVQANSSSASLALYAAGSTTPLVTSDNGLIQDYRLSGLYDATTSYSLVVNNNIDTVVTYIINVIKQNSNTNVKAVIAERGTTEEYVAEPGDCYVDTPDAEEGSAERPFVIRTATELVTLLHQPENLNKYFRLGADIDLSGTSWTPVGTSANPFTGNFDGMGFTISGLLADSRLTSATDDVGLFGVNAGIIQNLRFADVTVYGERAAAVAGQNDTTGIIENVAIASGSIEGKNYGSGIAAINKGLIRYSYNKASINAKYAAGISTYNGTAGRIEQVYSIGDLQATISKAGISVNNHSTAVIKDAFVLMPTLLVDSNNNNGTVTNSEALPVRNLKDEVYLTNKGWDFDNIWEIVDGNYPSLKVMGTIDMDDAEDNRPDGTEDKPYIITDEGGLNAIRSDLSAHYVIYNNITMTQVFEPIGTDSQPFTGSLKGNNILISGLKINNGVKDPGDTTEYVGLFGVNDGTISGINLSFAKVNSAAADAYVGVFAGKNTGVIEKCGHLYGTLTVNGTAGGLVGLNEGILRNVYNQGDMLPNSGGASYRGGIAGVNADTGTIDVALNVATLGAGAGAIAYTNNGTINSSYALAGYPIFADTASTGSTADSGVYGLSKLKKQETYDTAWDFDTVWIISGNSLPVFRTPVAGISLMSGGLAPMDATCEHVVKISQANNSAKIYIEAEDPHALIDFNGGKYRGVYEGVVGGLINNRTEIIFSVTATDNTFKEHKLVILKEGRNAEVQSVTVDGSAVNAVDSVYKATITSSQATTAKVQIVAQNNGTVRVLRAADRSEVTTDDGAVIDASTWTHEALPLSDDITTKFIIEITSENGANRNEFVLQLDKAGIGLEYLKVDDGSGWSALNLAADGSYSLDIAKDLTSIDVEMKALNAKGIARINNSGNNARTDSQTIALDLSVKEIYIPLVVQVDGAAVYNSRLKLTRQDVEKDLASISVNGHQVAKLAEQETMNGQLADVYEYMIEPGMTEAHIRIQAKSNFAMVTAGKNTAANPSNSNDNIWEDEHFALDSGELTMVQIKVRGADDGSTVYRTSYLRLIQKNDDVSLEEMTVSYGTTVVTPSLADTNDPTVYEAWVPDNLNPDEVDVEAVTNAFAAHLKWEGNTEFRRHKDSITGLLLPSDPSIVETVELVVKSSDGSKVQAYQLNIRKTDMKIRSVDVSSDLIGVPDVTFDQDTKQYVTRIEAASNLNRVRVRVEANVATNFMQLGYIVKDSMDSEAAFNTLVANYSDTDSHIKWTEWQLGTVDLLNSVDLNTSDGGVTMVKVAIALPNGADGTPGTKQVFNLVISKKYANTDILINVNNNALTMVDYDESSHEEIYEIGVPVTANTISMRIDKLLPYNGNPVVNVTSYSPDNLLDATFDDGAPYTLNLFPAGNTAEESPDNIFYLEVTSENGGDPRKAKVTVYRLSQDIAIDYPHTLVANAGKLNEVVATPAIDEFAIGVDQLVTKVVNGQQVNYIPVLITTKSPKAKITIDGRTYTGATQDDPAASDIYQGTLVQQRSLTNQEVISYTVTSEDGSKSVTNRLSIRLKSDDTTVDTVTVEQGMMPRAAVLDETTVGGDVVYYDVKMSSAEFATGVVRVTVTANTHSNMATAVLEDPNNPGDLDQGITNTNPDLSYRIYSYYPVDSTGQLPVIVKFRIIAENGSIQDYALRIHKMDTDNRDVLYYDRNVTNADGTTSVVQKPAVWAVAPGGLAAVDANGMPVAANAEFVEDVDGGYFVASVGYNVTALDMRVMSDNPEAGIDINKKNDYKLGVSTLSLSGLNAGEAYIFDFSIRSQDQMATNSGTPQTYKLHVDRVSENRDLKTLILNAGMPNQTVVEEIDHATKTIKLVVPYGSTSANLTLQADNSSAIVKYVGQDINGNIPAGANRLTVDLPFTEPEEQKYTFQVYNNDGNDMTPATYMVTLTRRSNTLTLSEVKLDGRIATQDMNDPYLFTIDIGSSETSTKGEGIRAVATVPEEMVRIVGSSVFSPGLDIYNGPDGSGIDFSGIAVGESQDFIIEAGSYDMVEQNGQILPDQMKQSRLRVTKLDPDSIREDLRAEFYVSGLENVNDYRAATSTYHDLDNHLSQYLAFISPNAATAYIKVQGYSQTTEIVANGQTFNGSATFSVPMGTSDEIQVPIALKAGGDTWSYTLTIQKSSNNTAIAVKGVIAEPYNKDNNLMEVVYGKASTPVIYKVELPTPSSSNPMEVNYVDLSIQAADSRAKVQFFKKDATGAVIFESQQGLGEQKITIPVWGLNSYTQMVRITSRNGTEFTDYTVEMLNMPADTQIDSLKVGGKEAFINGLVNFSASIPTQWTGQDFELALRPTNGQATVKINNQVIPKNSEGLFVVMLNMSASELIKKVPITVTAPSGADQNYTLTIYKYKYAYDLDITVEGEVTTRSYDASGVAHHERENMLPFNQKEAEIEVTLASLGIVDPDQDPNNITTYSVQIEDNLEGDTTWHAITTDNPVVRGTVALKKLNNSYNIKVMASNSLGDQMLPDVSVLVRRDSVDDIIGAVLVDDNEAMPTYDTDNGKVIFNAYIYNSKPEGKVEVLTMDDYALSSVKLIQPSTGTTWIGRNDGKLLAMVNGLVEGDNLFNIEVTMGGVIKSVYDLNIKYVPVDIYLDDLVVKNAGTDAVKPFNNVAFNKDVLSYEITYGAKGDSEDIDITTINYDITGDASTTYDLLHNAPYNIETNVKIGALAEQPKLATEQVTVDLTDGDRLYRVPVSVMVPGYTKTYYINFHKLSDDTELADLKVVDHEILQAETEIPGFDMGVDNYTLAVESYVDKVDIDALARHAHVGASTLVSVDKVVDGKPVLVGNAFGHLVQTAALNYGENIFNIRVTAENGVVRGTAVSETKSVEKPYTIVIYRKPAEAKIATLMVNGMPAISVGNDQYIAYVQTGTVPKVEAGATDPRGIVTLKTDTQEEVSPSPGAVAVMDTRLASGSNETAGKLPVNGEHL